MMNSSSAIDGPFSEISRTKPAQAGEGEQRTPLEAGPRSAGSRLRARRRHDESGFTLVEILVTIVVLSVAGIALITGLMSSISMSDLNRTDSTEVAVLHNYAETIKSAVAANCPQFPPGINFTTLYTPPAGYTVGLSTLPPGYSATATSLTGPCPTPATALTLSAASTATVVNNKYYSASASLNILVVVP